MSQQSEKPRDPWAHTLAGMDVKAIRKHMGDTCECGRPARDHFRGNWSRFVGCRGAAARSAQDLPQR